MSRWFRIDDDVVHDIKVQALPGDLFKAWINILCIASKNNGRLPVLNAVAFALRTDETAAFEVLTKLRKAELLDLIDNTLVPHNWEGRQFITDDADGSGTPSAIRSRNYRARKAAEKAARERDASRDATVTASRPDTDTDIDTDTNTETEEGKGSREVALLGWPADYRERFWARYPNKVGKADAVKKLDKAKGSVPFEDLMAGLERYIAKTDDRPWCNPATWIFQCRWTDQPATASPIHAKQRPAGSLIASLQDELARSIEEDRRRAEVDSAVLSLPARSIQ